MVEQSGPGEIPDIKKPDLQILLQDMAALRRDVFEERRNTDRVVAAERDRARWEMGKAMSESSEKIRGLEKENEALVRTLGRLQSEVDRLREESAVLRAGHAHIENVAPKEPARDASPLGPLQRIGVGANPLQVVVGPSSPPLGKTIPIDPTKL